PTGAPGGRQPPARAPPESAPPPDGDEDAVPDDALEFDASQTDVNSVFVEPAPDPQWTAATGSFKAMRASGPDAPVDVEIDSALLADIVQGEPPGNGSVGASRSVAAALAPAARTAPPSRAGTSVAETAPRAAQTRIATDGTATAGGPAGSAARETEAAEAAAEAMLPAPHPLARVLTRLSARESAPWAIGAAALLLLLAAQIVNHFRDALATHARLNRPLTALYAALGVSLRPQWDLHAYDVRQLGASVDPGSGAEITVRASIRNGGPQPQPLPLLRVTLEDRFGTPLASRDVSPRDYLPGAVPASSFLAVDQRIDAEMAFVDPGSSAVGFEIDACLPSAGGAVACAHDPASR
ncbi:MAG: DUF3426 domain-containing protein, partial [Steroidobacteraceae bacterium]